MATTAILGATSPVGSHILSTLRTLKASSVSSIDIVASRSVPPKTTSFTSNVPREHISSLSTWSSTLSTNVPHIVFSALDPLRVMAISVREQYKPTYETNIELAKAAKKAGTKIYVLVSSRHADLHSTRAIPKTDGEIEEYIKELDFEHTIILRPGVIRRTREESGPLEAIAIDIVAGLRRIHSGLVDSWAQTTDVVAKAAVHAALKVETGEVKDKVWILYKTDIMLLGKHEWKDL